MTDEELDAFLEYVSPKIHAYIYLKLLTGLSKQDLLCIRLDDIKEDGLHAFRRKTQSRPKVYSFDGEGILRGAIQEVKDAHRGEVSSLHLFHTRQGKPYYQTDADGHAIGKPDSFNSMWQRAMKRFKDDGHPGFTEHDLRAKAASDTTLHHAQALLDHVDPGTTERVYRRAPKVVPISKIKDDLSDKR